MLDDLFMKRSTRRFALQWHITHACELHCRHCYDRTKPSPLRLEQARAVVDDLLAFCSRHDVTGSVILTGGNPFLHPDFVQIYRYVAESGFGIGILGNPVERSRLEDLVRIRKPRYYQISLEGLEPHNDAIRGKGSFRRAMELLPILRELKIESHVMITVTAANVDELVPLAQSLRGEVDHVRWNRLSQFGEGADLEPIDTQRFASFMKEWIVARIANPHMGMKDNLFNIPHYQLGMPLFGGCTGYGCGAAFNFVALLPDGEAHACRKLPSPIGNVLKLGLEGVYQSEAARRYRRGCTECDGCPIRARCGGCMAIAQGQGLDPFEQKDPNCFWGERDTYFPGCRHDPVDRETIADVIRLIRHPKTPAGP